MSTSQWLPIEDRRPPLDTVLRRFVLWTVICCVSAAPSFAIAYQTYNRAAMVVGVGMFIVIYTALTSTPAFERFNRRPFVRRTLYIGYGLRLLLSIAYPVGVFVDIWPGVLSIGLVERMGMRPQSFEGTFAITCIQGAWLNAIIFVFMLVIYVLQRAFMKPPVEVVPVGFDVVMNAHPAVSPAPRSGT